MIGMDRGTRNEMGPSGQPDANVIPTNPYQLVPAWHPRAPAQGPWSSCVTQADAADSAGSSYSLKQHVGMFLEVVGIADTPFNKRWLCFNFPWSCCLLLLFSLHLSSLRASVFQVFPFRRSVWISTDYT